MGFFRYSRISIDNLSIIAPTRQFDIQGLDGQTLKRFNMALNNLLPDFIRRLTYRDSYTFPKDPVKNFGVKASAQIRF